MYTGCFAGGVRTGILAVCSARHRSSCRDAPASAAPGGGSESTRRDGITCLISTRIRLLSPSDRLSCDAAGTSRTMLWGNKSGTSVTTSGR